MKVERPDLQQQPFPNGKRVSSPAVSDTFGAILKDATDKIRQCPIPSAPPVLPSAAFHPGLNRADGALLDKAGELIESMASFQSLLASRGPDAQAYVALRAMDDKADELLSGVENLPESSLRDALNRMVVTATVEGIKFRRGDFE